MIVCAVIKTWQRPRTKKAASEVSVVPVADPFDSSGGEIAFAVSLHPLSQFGLDIPHFRQTQL